MGRWRALTLHRRLCECKAEAISAVKECGALEEVLTETTEKQDSALTASREQQLQLERELKEARYQLEEMQATLEEEIGKYGRDAQEAAVAAADAERQRAQLAEEDARQLHNRLLEVTAEVGPGNCTQSLIVFVFNFCLPCLQLEAGATREAEALQRCNDLQNNVNHLEKVL